MKKLIALALLLGCGVAQAAPLTWTFNDTLLTDGSYLIGSFDFDASTNLYSNIDLINIGGPDLTADYGSLGASPFIWNSSTQIGQEFGGDSREFSGEIATACEVDNCGRAFLYIFDGQLTDAGGVVGVMSGSLESFWNGTNSKWLYLGNGIYPFTNNATVSAVPIPAAVWLFGSALAGLGWMRRRKTV